MICPNCKKDQALVIDSRPTDDKGRRRRYRCYACDHRFTTYEYGKEQLEDKIKKSADKKLKEEFAKKIVEYIKNELQ